MEQNENVGISQETADRLYKAFDGCLQTEMGVRKMLEDAIANNQQIILTGGRNSGKRLIQNYIFMKQWDKTRGKVYNVGINGITECELADAEEIKE